MIDSLIQQHRTELMQRQSGAYENDRRMDELRSIIAALDAAKSAVNKAPHETQEPAP